MFFAAKVAITVLASALITTVAAQSPQITCYAGGLEYNCSKFIDQFCAHAVVSSYNPYDNFSRCYNNGSGDKCDLIVWLNNPSGGNQIPSYRNCKATLEAASNACRSGGFGRFPNGAFRFAIDPNRGRCGGDAQAGSREADASEVKPVTAATYTTA